MRASGLYFLAWVMIAAFALPTFKPASANDQTFDHSHEELHHESSYAYNSHESADASKDAHTHEHRHGPGEPLHHHEHKHSPQVNTPDTKISSTSSVYRPTPILSPVEFSLVGRNFCRQGYLKSIFRPPIA